MANIEVYAQELTNGDLAFFKDNAAIRGVVNSNGTTMTHRDKIKFQNAIVTDDSTNDCTVVKNGVASKGSATKGIYYDANGDVQEMTYSLEKSVPSNAVFTDTTYSSKTASSGSSEVSLVTRGEKYTWNNKGTGDVTGPSSSTNNRVAVFDGTTGKAIKDSGYTIASSVPSGAAFTDTTNLSSMTGILSTSHGGTGNTAGYIRTGQKSGTTIGTSATAEGSNTTASGNYSHASGIGTTAGYEAQFVCGKYNNNDSNTLFEVGDGSSSNKHSLCTIQSPTSTNDNEANIKIVNKVDSNNMKMYTNTNHQGLTGSAYFIRRVFADDNYAFRIGADKLLVSSTETRPLSNGSVNLGNGSYRWKQLYAATTTISTSDKNLKRNIQPIDETLEKIFLETPTYSYYFKNGDRRHIGTIAQDVEEVIEDNGLTSMDFAALCKDYIETRYEEDEEGTLREVSIPEDEKYWSYSFRYEEYIMLTVHMVQKLYKENEELKSRIAALESMAHSHAL